MYVLSMRQAHRILLLAGLCLLVVTPPVQADTWRVSAISGFYDARIDSTANGETLTRTERHALKQRGSSKGQVFEQGVGSIPIRVRGNYDGSELRTPQNGNPPTSCERHINYTTDTRVDLTFTPISSKKARVGAVLTVNDQSDSVPCRLPHEAGADFGTRTVTARTLRRGKVSLTYRGSRTEDDGTRLSWKLTVKAKRSRR